MMPTAKKKLPGIGMFLRQTEGSFTVAAPAPGSPKGGGLVGLPGTPASFRDTNVAGAGPGQGHAQSSQLQPVPEIAARQEMAAAARLPMSRAGRYATSSSQQQPAVSPPSQHYHPMQRARTTVSEHGLDTKSQRARNQIWEDSTVTSMFDDDVEEMFRPVKHQRQRTRQLSNASDEQQPHPPSQLHRVQPLQSIQNGQSSQDQNLHFLIGENGMMKMIDPPSAPNRRSATNLDSGLLRGILREQPPEANPYRNDHRVEDLPPSKSALRRAKLPHRDVHDTRRNSFTERLASYPPETNSVVMSPEKSSEAGEQLEVHRQADKARRRQQLDLEYKRSTVFEDLSPVEEPSTNFDNTRAAVGVTSSEETTEDLKESLTESPPISRHPLAIQNARLQETTLGQTDSRRLKQASKKRRHSVDEVDYSKVDYNDAELDEMSFSDLRKEPFDYDPQAAAALQQHANPAAISMADKLKHYRTQDSIEQHQFFNQVSVQEWDEAGDWFLEQFSDVVKRMKEARKNKRALVAQYEEEISAREEAVRGKVEGIERTLDDLKEEGQSMMQGKATDLEF